MENIDLNDVSKQTDLSSSDDPGDTRALINIKKMERILGNLDYEQNHDDTQELGKRFNEFFRNLKTKPTVSTSH